MALVGRWGWCWLMVVMTFGWWIVGGTLGQGNTRRSLPPIGNFISSGTNGRRLHWLVSIINCFSSSFHEIGVYDLPATIDYILDKTNKDQLSYIGHSQGCTTFFIMGSVKPDYMKKINVMAALAPAVFMANTSHPLVKLAAQPLVNLALGVGIFKRSTWITTFEWILVFNWSNTNVLGRTALRYLHIFRHTMRRQNMEIFLCKCVLRHCREKRWRTNRLCKLTFNLLIVLSPKLCDFRILYQWFSLTFLQEYHIDRWCITCKKFVAVYSSNHLSILNKTNLLLKNR